jgi:cytoskeleton protein RodZ
VAKELRFEQIHGNRAGVHWNKGFVRAYARYLGIDEDQAVTDFVIASGGEKEQPLPDPPVPRAVALGQSTTEHANWRAFALLVLLLATAVAAAWKMGPLAFYRVSEILTSRLKHRPATPSSPRVTPQPTRDAGMAAPLSRAPAVQKKPVGQAKTVDVAISNPAAGPATAKAAALGVSERSSPADHSFVVQIRATEDAWVQIMADGKLLSEGVLVAPAEKRVRATKEVTVKTGNAAGVEISFNGQPLPSLGPENTVATVTLTPEGMQR